MVDMNVIRRLEMRADVPGASEAAAQLRNLQGGFEAMQRAAEAATKSVEKNGQTVISTDRQYQNFLRRTVPGFREFEQFTRDVNMLDAALSQSRGVQDFSRNFDLARQKLPEARAEMVRMREEQAALDRALEQTQRRIATSAASWEEYQERIAAARHAQNSAEFGRATNERLGIGVPSATSRGASYSALAEREAAIAAAHKVAEDEITKAVREQRLQYEQLERVADQYRQETDGFATAQIRYAKAVEQVNTMERMGIGTAQERTKWLEHEAATLQRVQGELSGQSKYRQMLMRDLAFQGKDYFEQVLAGGSPVRAALMQGPQAAAIMKMGGFGVGDVFESAAGSASKLFTKIGPLGAMLGTVTAVVAGGAYAWYRYDASMKAVEQSLYGIGRASGVTAGQVDKMARVLPWSSGVSTSTARGTISRALGTGEINAGDASYIGQYTRDYGTTTGQSYEQAEKEMISSFANMGQGVDIFAAKIGGISPRVQQAIKDLVDMGDKAGANRLAIAALTGQLVPYTEQLTALGAAWDKTKTVGSEFLDVVGRKIDLAFGFGPLEDQLANLRSNLESIKAMGPLYIFGDQAAVEKRIRELEALIEKRKVAQTGVADSKRAGLLEADIRATMPDIEAERLLRVGATRLRNRTQDQAALGLLSPEAAAQAAAAEERWRLARESFIVTDRRLAEQQQINLRSVMALTAGQEAGIAADQKRLEAKGDITKAYRAETDAVNAATLVYARYEKAATDALRQSGYGLRSAGMLPYMRGLTDLRSQMEEELLKVQGPGPELARARAAIIGRFANERRKYTIDQIGGPIQQSKIGLNEQIASLETQAKSFYASAEAAGTYAAKQELTNQYLRMGITPVGALAQQIDDLAARYGKLTGEAEKFARTSQNIVQGMDEIRSGSRGLLTGVFSDARQGKNPLDGIKNQLGGMADRLFDRTISKPFVEMAAGFDGKGGGGWFGNLISQSGIFGDLTGTGKGLGKVTLPSVTSTATMNVQAALVNLSGGMGAGLPGVTGALPAGAAAAGRGAFTVTEQPGVTPWPASPVTAAAIDPARSATEWDRLIGNVTFPPRIPGVPLNGSMDSTTEYGRRLSAGLDAAASRMAQASDDTSASLSKVGAAGGDAVDGLLSLAQGAVGAAGKALSSFVPSGFASGGYTGPGGRHEPAGIVHRGEYVFSAPAVSRIGIGALDAMHSGMPGYATGGYVGHYDWDPTFLALRRHLPGYKTGGLVRDPLRLGGVLHEPFAGRSTLHDPAGSILSYRDPAMPVPVMPSPVMLAPVMAPATQAAPIVNHTVINHAGAQIETRESRGPNGEINMETVVRHVERNLAGRMMDGRGALRGAVRNEAGGSAATRMG